MLAASKNRRHGQPRTRAHRRARGKTCTSDFKTCIQRRRLCTALTSHGKTRCKRGHDYEVVQVVMDYTFGHDEISPDRRRRHDYDNARLRSRRPRLRPSSLRPGRHCRKHRPSVHVQRLRRDDRAAQRDGAKDRRHRIVSRHSATPANTSTPRPSSNTCEPASTTRPTDASIGSIRSPATCKTRSRLHKYAYVHGDPIQGIDPTGLFGGFSVGGMLATVAIGAQMHAISDQGNFVALQSIQAAEAEARMGGDFFEAANRHLRTNFRSFAISSIPIIGTIYDLWNLGKFAIDAVSSLIGGGSSSASRLAIGSGLAAGNTALAKIARYIRFWKLSNQQGLLSFMSVVRGKRLNHHAGLVAQGTVRKIPGTPGVVTRGNGGTLAANIRNNSLLPTQLSGTQLQAQHIIPSQLRTNAALQKIGMDLNHHTNGIMLPDNALTSTINGGSRPLSGLPTHQGSHSAYTAAIERKLNSIDPNLSVQATMEKVALIQERARSGTALGLPIRNGDGATTDMWSRYIGAI